MVALRVRTPATGRSPRTQGQGCRNCGKPLPERRGRVLLHCDVKCRSEASRKQRPWLKAKTPQEVAAVIGARLPAAPKPAHACRRKRVELYLEPKHRRMLDTRARRDGVSRSEALRRILDTEGQRDPRGDHRD